MKRALVAFAFGLAACSSGGGAGEPGTRDAATTTTRDPAEAFAARINIELVGDTEEDREQAAVLARAMCDLLDSAVMVPALDDAENDTPESDAELSSLLVDEALRETFVNSGLPTDVAVAVMRTGAEHFCPDNAYLVDDFTEGLGG